MNQQSHLLLRTPTLVLVLLLALLTAVTASAQLFTLEQTFDDPTPSADTFGVSVALDGNCVLVGASGDDTLGPNVGQAHLFDTATGNLLHTFDDPTVTFEDLFGNSVALDGDHVLIGATLDDTHGDNVGQAHLFDGTTGNLLHTFDNPVVNGNDGFGYSVALDGSRVLIGASFNAPWQTYLFDAATGNVLRTFDVPIRGSRLVALDGNHVLIAVGSDEARLFDATTGNLLHTFDVPTSSVALDGNHVLIGADDEARLFDATTGNLLHTFNNPVVNGDERFGSHVALEGNRVLIGDYRFTNSTGETVGRAYLYTPSCDFNSDAACDIRDLNLLLAEGPIAPGVTVTPGVNDQFDLTGDGVIDLADQDQWLTDAATINGLASPYKLGDANLDGIVDVSDFDSWNTARFTSSLNWDDANFNGDTGVDVSDFNHWNTNKFTESDGVSLVPEPSSVCLVAIVVIVLASHRYRRS